MQTPSGNEPGTPVLAEKPTERIEQSSSSPLTSSDASAFAANTIEIRLVIQPEDGHPEGRRIRHVIALDGKTLQIGALRTRPAMEQLRSLESEQAVAHVVQWLTQIAEDHHVLTRSAIGSPQPSPGESSVSASPRTATAASLPQEGSREMAQQATAQPPQASGETAVPQASPLALYPQRAAMAPEDSQKKPEQLTLF